MNNSDLKPKTLFGIDSCRGLAAISVAFYHISSHLQYNYGVNPFGRVPQFGHAGVDFFFVLSGFIISFVHRSDLNNPTNLVKYAKKRFARIYPFYWFCCVVTLAMVPLIRSSHFQKWFNILLCFALFPRKMNVMVLTVSWTLQHEVIFYVLFAILIFNFRIGVTGLALWLVLCIYNCWIHPISHYPAILSAFNVQFFMGMAAAYLVASDHIKHPKTMLTIGIFIFTFFAVLEDIGIVNGYSDNARIFYGLGAMLIIVGIARMELVGNLRVPKIMRLLGKSSYSIYLTHLIISGIGIKLLEISGFDKIMPLWVFASLLIIGTITGAVITSQFVEIPLTNATRRILNANPGKNPRQVS